MEEIKVGEIWKDIKDFPNYQISNFGRVKSKERITKVGIKNVKEIAEAENFKSFLLQLLTISLFFGLLFF